MCSVYYLCIGCYMRFRYWRLLVEPFHVLFKAKSYFSRGEWKNKLCQIKIKSIKWLCTYKYWYTEMTMNSYILVKTTQQKCYSLVTAYISIIGAIQVLRNAVGREREGKKHRKNLRFNVIRVTRGWGCQSHRKKASHSTWMALYLVH